MTRVLGITGVCGLMELFLITATRRFRTEQTLRVCAARSDAFQARGLATHKHKCELISSFPVASHTSLIRLDSRVIEVW
jgi:hypothetical protein